MGTAMILDLRFGAGSAIRRVRTQTSHKEPVVGKSVFSLTRKFETVPQPEDTIAELAATYIAPRLMQRIERGETVTIGDRIALNRTGLHLRFMLSKRSIPWLQCLGIDSPSDGWRLRLVDGHTVELPGGVQAQNLLALELLAPALCAPPQT